MSWIRRETEKGTFQYICTRCHDYHEFREDFGERTFSENYIFCRRCGARNGTGNAPTLTPPNEWVSVEESLPEKRGEYIVCACDEGEPIDERIWGDTVVICADYYDGTFTWYEGDTEYDISDIVTHWMPLPAPPNCRPPEGER